MSVKVKLMDNLRRTPHLTESQVLALNLYERTFLRQSGIKTKMTNLFKRPKLLKNGEIGKTLETPTVEELHTTSPDVELWVQYATLDAESTYYLREALVQELRKFKVEFEDMSNLFDLYCKYWLPFGELLTDLERHGIRVNKQQLHDSEKRAEEDLKVLEFKFKEWVLSIRPEADEFNLSSTQQLQQLLFAPFKRIKQVKTVIESPEDQEILKDFDQAELDMVDPDHEERMAQGGASSAKSPRNIDTNMDFPAVREFTVLNTKVKQIY